VTSPGGAKNLLLRYANKLNVAPTEARRHTLLFSRAGCRTMSEGVVVRAGVLSGMVFGIGLAACAGRDPHPVAVVQPQDVQSDCAAVG
jgi:hypothetical protein